MKRRTWIWNEIYTAPEKLKYKCGSDPQVFASGTGLPAPLSVKVEWFQWLDFLDFGDQSCMWQQEADHCDVSCRCSKCNIVGPLQLPLITVSSDTAWYLLHPRSSSALTQAQCETASVDQLASSHTQTTWCGLISPQCLWYLSVCVLVYWSHLKQSTFSPLPTLSVQSKLLKEQHGQTHLKK